jgi:hypothetical protein
MRVWTVTDTFQLICSARTMPMPAHIRAAHDHASNHYDEIMASGTCGCFYCTWIFTPDQITNWAGRYNDGIRPPPPQNKLFALCPSCGIDAVIGSASGLPITKEFLREMNRYWFALASDDPDEPVALS